MSSQVAAPRRSSSGPDLPNRASLASSFQSRRIASDCLSSGVDEFSSIVSWSDSSDAESSLLSSSDALDDFFETYL
jgi:hypothetical protein